ncbi:MAG: hypothetical protein ACFFDH_00555 [Promethearchaeota archaeon]
MMNDRSTKYIIWLFCFLGIITILLLVKYSSELENELDGKNTQIFSLNQELEKSYAKNEKLKQDLEIERFNETEYILDSGIYVSGLDFNEGLFNIVVLDGDNGFVETNEKTIALKNGDHYESFEIFSGQEVEVKNIKIKLERVLN